MFACSYNLSLRTCIKLVDASTLLKFSSACKFLSPRDFSVDININNKKIQNEILQIFDHRPVNERILDSVLDKYKDEMDSKNILTLVHNMQKERISLPDDRLRKILRILRDRTSAEEFSGGSIYSLVRFSKGIRNKPLKMELWDFVLLKVCNFVTYLLLLNFNHSLRSSSHMFSMLVIYV